MGIDEDLKVWIHGKRSRVEGSEFRGSGELEGFRGTGSGGLGFKVQRLGLIFCGLGFRVSGIRVSGLV